MSSWRRPRARFVELRRGTIDYQLYTLDSAEKLKVSHNLKESSAVP